MDAQSKKFLTNYLNNHAPVGYEQSGQKLWINYLRPYVDDFITDVYGSVAAVINPGAPYKVVLEAHADEIAWYINYITPKGYMYITRNGGSDYQIAPAKYVHIHRLNQPPVAACVGWPAIHVRQADEKRKKMHPSIDNIVLDAGFASDKEAVAAGVDVGSVVTFDQPLRWLNKEKYAVGRGLDNRMGGFMIAEVARLLHEQKTKLPFALYIVNAVQEEVGLRGAAMMAARIKPDVALITDVTHDTDSPTYNKIRDGHVVAGKGPVIAYAPSVHRLLRQMVEDRAKEMGISYQKAAGSYTGTDTDAFAYAGVGTASALISLPLKYMHTTVEMVAVADVEAIIQLLKGCVEKLPVGYNFSYPLV